MNTKIQDLIITISAFALLVMLAVSTVAIAGRLVFKNDPFTMILGGTENISTEIVVQPGDTLWSIARIQVPDEDPRDVVGIIKELNELSSAEIFPGQVLTVELKQVVEPVRLANGPIR